jgi:hypothetical protein
MRVAIEALHFDEGNRQAIVEAITTHVVDAVVTQVPPIPEHPFFIEFGLGQPRVQPVIAKVEGTTEMDDPGDFSKAVFMSIWKANSGLCTIVIDVDGQAFIGCEDNFPGV